jgi:hypothetical protein
MKDEILSVTSQTIADMFGLCVNNLHCADKIFQPTALRVFCVRSANRCLRCICTNPYCFDYVREKYIQI